MNVDDMATEYAIELGWARCLVTVQYLQEGDVGALYLLEGLMDREVEA